MVWESGAPIIYQALTSVRGRYVIFKYIQLTYEKKNTNEYIEFIIYYKSKLYIYIYIQDTHPSCLFQLFMFTGRQSCTHGSETNEVKQIHNKRQHPPMTTDNVNDSKAKPTPIYDMIFCLR